MKKSLAILLAVELVIINGALSGLVAPTKAQTTTEIFLEPGSFTAGRIGETFNVAVNIRNIEATQRMVMAQFRVIYNDTMLEALDVTEGTFLRQFNNTADQPYTYLIEFIEKDPLFGPNVLVGILLTPSSTPNGGVWTNFPEGSGTLATITFRTQYRPKEPMPTATCVLNLTDTMLVDDNINQILHIATSATYMAQPLLLPKISIQPSSYQANLVGETFDMSANMENLDVDWRLVFAQFRIQYDASVLKAIDAKEGTFMQQSQNSAEAPYTFFIEIIEDDPLYGPNVLIGILLMPNATGQWTDFPEGSGTLATITFEAIKQTSEPQPFATSMLTLNDTLLVDENITEIPHTLANADYQIQPLSFSYAPSPPLAEQPVFFNTTRANYTVTYSWDFGDGTNSNVSEPTMGHIYATPGEYNVALTCIADGLTSSKVTKTISVLPNSVPAIDVTADVGKTHFRGETADFGILVSSHGEAVNATRIEALLYHDDTLAANLTSLVKAVRTGLYTILYNIPVNAETGTYRMMVQAEYYNAKGNGIASFQISPTLTNWNDSMAKIVEIEGETATIQTDIDSIKVNLTSINARLTGIEGNTAIIDSKIGTLQTDLTNINATLTGIIVNSRGEVLAKIDSALGSITTKLGDTQSTVTTTLYVASILSAIILILALAILMFVRKK